MKRRKRRKMTLQPEHTRKTSNTSLQTHTLKTHSHHYQLTQTTHTHTHKKHSPHYTLKTHTHTHTHTHTLMPAAPDISTVTRKTTDPQQVTTPPHPPFLRAPHTVLIHYCMC